MTDMPRFEDLVDNHITRLRVTIRRAGKCGSLETVDLVTTSLVKTISLSEMIRDCHAYETEDAKIRAFQAVIDWYVKWATRYEHRPGGFYATDTYPTSFNTGVILDYKPPG